MRRRVFITLLGAAAAWPSAADAQQPTLPVIGFLGSPNPDVNLATALRNGLNETGYVVDKNFAIEFLWAGGRYDRLPELAADLVRREVAVIVAAGPPAAHAASAATRTIPIVFVSGEDPVKSGLVVSLSHPGGNVTGVALLTGQLGAKTLGLLRELLPKAAVVAILVNPNNPLTEAVLTDVQAAATVTGHRIQVVNARDEGEIDKAFATLKELPVDALIVGADPYFFTRSDQLVALAARYAIPAFYELREFAANGGLMSQ